MTDPIPLAALLDDAAIRPVLGPFGAWLDPAAVGLVVDGVAIGDLRVWSSPRGDARSWTFDVVVAGGISLGLPVPGLELAINPGPPGAGPGAPAVIPAQLSVATPIGRWVGSVDEAALSTTAGIADLLARISGATPADLVAATVDLLVDDPDPVQALLTAWAQDHGPLAVTVDPDPAVTAVAIAGAMTATGIDVADHLLTTWVETGSRSATLARLARLYSPWCDLDAVDLDRLARPWIEARLTEVTVALSLPRDLLVPIKTAAHTAAGLAPGVAEGASLPAPHRSRLDATLTGVGFDTDRGLRIDGAPTFSLDESALGSTGLRLAADALRVDASPSETPAELRRLGFGAAFVGIDVAGARLGWHPPLRPVAGGPDGLTIDIDRLAIGNEGLSLAVARRWSVADADPFGSGSELVLRLPNGWRVAPRLVEGEVHYRRREADGSVEHRWRSSLVLAAHLELPFWGAAVDVAIRHEIQADGFRFRLALGLGSGPLTVELGAPGGGGLARLTVERLDAVGTLAADGSFMLSGAASLGASIGPVDRPILDGWLDATAASIESTDRTTVRFDGTIDATLFAGSAYQAAVEGAATSLVVEADDTGVTAARLELVGFRTELRFGDTLVVDLRDCAVDLDDTASPPAALDLGFGPDFVGLVAGRADLTWAPPGLAQPIEVTVGTAAAGSTGLALRQSFVDQPVIEPVPGVALRLDEIDGLLSFDDDTASRLDVAGTVTLPVLGQLAGRLHLRHGPLGDEAALTVTATGVTLPLGPAGTLTIGALTLDGSLADRAAELRGQVAGGALALTGVDPQIVVDAAVVSLVATGDRLALSVAVDQLRAIGGDGTTADRVELGALGPVADLVLDVEGRSTDVGFEPDVVVVTAELTWADVRDLIPPGLPDLGLPDDGKIEATLSWRTADDPAAGVGGPGADGAPALTVELTTEVGQLDDLWGFLPAPYRPAVRSVRSFFRLSYASTSDLTAGTALDVELSARIELELPAAVAVLDVPGLDLLDLRPGSDDGILVAEYRAQFEAGDAEDRIGFTSGLHLEDVIELDIRLPGGIASEPLIAAEVTRVGFGLGIGAGGVGGRLLFEGSFRFRPLVPTAFPLAEPLNALLRDLGLHDVRGRVRSELEFDDGGTSLTLAGRFDAFGIELDVFDLLAALASGVGSPGGPEIDVDFDIGFRLIGFDIAVATGDRADDDGLSFAFDLTVECTMTGLPPVTARLRLTDEELSLGLVDLDIPLRMPRYPIGVADLERLAGADGIWRTGELDAFTDELTTWIDDLTADIAGAPDRTTELELQGERAGLELKRLLLQLVMEIHQRVADGGQPLFQTLVVADTAIHESVLGLLRADTTIRLHFPEIAITVPFENPAGIGISGEARFVGFAPDDPLRALEDYTLTLGLSAEYVYAALTGGERIPLPAFGTPYDDGSLSIAGFSIGYGYTKNSFAFDVSGELILPSRLRDDLDASATIGAGVRLPRHNKVFFKLDTIVVTIGKVTVPIPLPRFDVDLRTPGVPPLLEAGGRRRPAWDGFEVIVPGVAHAAFKRLAFSPFFGFFLLPNVAFDGDLELGDERNGATLILNDLLVLAGLVAGTTALVPVPVVADPTAPYFDNVVVNLRVAGFAINFELERPFPQPSPLALVEAFGLVADPMLEIDPEGPLANIVRFRLDNAYVRLPEFVVQMFPGAESVVDKRYGFTLNLGTLIAMTQAVVEAIGPVIDAIDDPATWSFLDLAVDWPAAARFDPWAVVKTLPPELRKFRFGGRLAGFEASACLVIADAAEARASLRALAGRGIQPSGTDVNLPVSALDRRRPVLVDESARLLAGIEFRQFTADDLDRLPVDDLAIDPEVTGAVVLAAYVRVAGGQKLRFLGQLFDNGSFALISAAEVEPLRLRVLGLDVALPFEGYGALALVGGQKRSGAWGAIRGEGAFRWAPIPGVLLVRTPEGRPARMELHSDGRFRVEAGAEIDLFDGAATITGSATATQDRLAFDGRLRYRPQVPGLPDLIEIDATGAGVVRAIDQGRGGAGRVLPSLAFDARGRVTILGQPLADVAVAVDDHRASFDVRLAKPVNRGPATPIEQAVPLLRHCGIELSGRGLVDLRRTARPRVELEGEGRIQAFGATIDGRAGFRTQPGSGRRNRNDFFEAWAEGELSWNGRRWLGGRLSVGSRGLRLAGSTSVGLDVSPSRLPGGVDVAHLFVHFDVDGWLAVDPVDLEATFLLRGSWSVGVGLPGTGARGGAGPSDRAQILPLASNRFSFYSQVGPELTLIDIDGFGYLPIDGLTIPVPRVTITPAGAAIVRAGTLASDEDVSAIDFITPLGVVGFTSNSPIPHFGAGRDLADPVTELASAYQATVDWEAVSLDPTVLGRLTVGLALDRDAAADRFPLRLVLTAGPSQRREIPF